MHGPKWRGCVVALLMMACVCGGVVAPADEDVPLFLPLGLVTVPRPLAPPAWITVSYDRGPWYSARTQGEDFVPLVVMAVWQDGRIVWSEDSVRGGRPFLEGRLSETDLITLRTGLETAGVYGADAPVPIPTPSMFTAMTRIVIHEDDALIAGILPEEPSVKRGGDVPSEDEQEHLQQVAIEYQALWGQVLETLYQAKDAASDPQETDIQFAIRFRLRGSGQ